MYIVNTIVKPTAVTAVFAGPRERARSEGAKAIHLYDAKTRFLRLNPRYENKRIDVYDAIISFRVSMTFLQQQQNIYKYM